MLRQPEPFSLRAGERTSFRKNENQEKKETEKAREIFQALDQENQALAKEPIKGLWQRAIATDKGMGVADHHGLGTQSRGKP